MKGKIITACFCLIMCGAFASCEKSETAIESFDISEQQPTAAPYYEATFSAALTVKLEASVYFCEHPADRKVIHDTFRNDDAFGSVILKKHPALEGMEYIDVPTNS